MMLQGVKLKVSNRWMLQGVKLKVSNRRLHDASGCQAKGLEEGFMMLQGVKLKVSKKAS